MLIVNKAYYPDLGGVETVVRQIAEIQAKNDDGCTVLTFNTENRLKVETIVGVDVIRLPVFYHNKSIRFSYIYRKKLKELTQRYCIVVYNYPSTQVDFIRKKYNNHFKVVYYHADVTRMGLVGMIYQKFFGRRFLANSDLIIASNENIVKSSKLLSQFAEKCEVLPYGIDTDKFHITHEHKRERILHDLKVKEAKLILFVGRMARYKGVEVLFNALAKLDAQYKLVVVSKQGFGSKHIKMIEELGIQERIVCYNGQGDDELVGFYNACDVFVLPSTDRAEAFGLVVVEAMACGLPVITTELGTGTSYHNLDGVTGRVITPSNADALEQSVKEICENPQNYPPEAMRKRAQDFSLEKFEQRWINFYRDLNIENKE